MTGDHVSTGPIDVILQDTPLFDFHGANHDFPARLQLFSDGIIRQLEEVLPRSFDQDQLRRFLGPAAAHYDPQALEAVLLTPIWDLISRRGKCWRAMFAIFLLESLGTPSGPYQNLICCLTELTHLGALIIDDIEDGSLRRRGAECLHLRYGLDVAANAGNTLYFLPLLLVSHHPHLTDKQRLEAFQMYADFFVRAHFGQAHDIYWSRHINRSNLEDWLAKPLKKQILQMYENKTAAAVMAVSEFAAIISGADHARRQICSEFARSFGVAFQIRDDVNNFTTALDFTKVCGEDLTAGKLTYVIYDALQRLAGTKRERLIDILCSRELRRNSSEQESGIALIRQSGALDACRSESQSIFQEAWQHFSQSIPDSGPRECLRMLCNHLLGADTEYSIV